MADFINRRNNYSLFDKIKSLYFHNEIITTDVIITISTMLKINPKLLNITNDDNRNILHFVLIYIKKSKQYNINNVNCITLVNLLLSSGINIYVRDYFDNLAIDYCNYTVLCQLINKYDYKKRVALCIIKRFLRYLLYLPPNGIIYKRAYNSWNNDMNFL